MITWHKKGLLFSPPTNDEWSHGSHPCIVHLDQDDFLIAFSRRDHNSHSHIFTCRARVTGTAIELITEPRIELSPGGKGYFDSDGVISASFIRNNDETYLYYVGWQNLPDTLWICDTGRAKYNRETECFEKEFPGPVLGRDKDNPLFAAATAFTIKSDGEWYALYNSGIKWEQQDSVAMGTERFKHSYGLYIARSRDGIDWISDRSRMAIPFRDEYEYAFGRPSAIKYKGSYHVWFACRATQDIDAYRMGYAVSDDFLTWVRNDEASGIDVSQNPSDWDHEMICYPSVFEHRGTVFMLYNGNNYGETGFGYAVSREN